MTRWMLANLQRGELNGVRILERESYEHLWSPSVGPGRGGDPVALSWFKSQYQGHRTIHHGGSDTGFRSFLMLLPDDGIGIVLASNWSRTDTNAIVSGIMAILLDAEAP